MNRLFASTAAILLLTACGSDTTNIYQQSTANASSSSTGGAGGGAGATDASTSATGGGGATGVGGTAGATSSSSGPVCPSPVPPGNSFACVVDVNGCSNGCGPLGYWCEGGSSPPIDGCTDGKADSNDAHLWCCSTAHCVQYEPYNAACLSSTGLSVAFSCFPDDQPGLPGGCTPMSGQPGFWCCP